MPVTIKTTEPINKNKPIHENDLPLLVCDEDHVYLATLIVRESERISGRYAFVYIKDLSGEESSDFGEAFIMDSLQCFVLWNGSVNIENN